MTIKELRDKLAKFDQSKEAYVYWEGGSEHQFFGIEDVSESRGNHGRRQDNKVGFTFDSKGAVEWVFISVSPE
jgi:hypothetical protein